MNTDKRTVSTDALETLGTIINETQKRDAIHLAVDPAIAAHTLRPGEDVGFVEGGVGICDKPVGIVDPFLKANVKKGERFWLVVYPRKITSLRHVWSHPEFSDLIHEARDKDTKAESERWLRQFSEQTELSFSRVMECAQEWLDSDEYYTQQGGENMRDLFWDNKEDFWKHYQIFTGKRVEKEKQESFFSCSC